MGGVDVLLLPFLGASTKQDHERRAVFAKVDPIAGSKVDPVLEYAGSNALDIREVSARQSSDRRSHLRGGLRIEIVEPAGMMVTYVLPCVKHAIAPAG